MRARTYRQEQWAPGKGRGASKYPVVFLFLSIAPGTFCVNPKQKAILHDGWCSHLLLARVADILICVEKRPNVHGLAAPDLPVHCPIEREFQRAPVERTGERKKGQYLDKCVWPREVGLAKDLPDGVS